MRLLELLLVFPLAAMALCPDGYIYNSDFNRCYSTSTYSAPYFASRTYCTWSGGDLASIHSAFENSYIAGLLDHSNGFYWIGIRSSSPTGPWYWTDNWEVVPNYFNWAPANPPVNMWSGGMDTGTQQWMTAGDDDWHYFVCAASPIVPPPTCPPPPKCPICTTPPPIAPACEDGWTIYSKTNSCYKLLIGGSFLDAEENCQLSGAHIASVHSMEENYFIYSLAHTGAGNLDSGNQIWIGLYFTQGNWTNLDGSVVDYTNWNQGYPDEDAMCAVMLTDFQSETSTPTKWITRQCYTTERAHVCKKAIHGN